MGFKNTFIDANSACCSKQDENNNLILHTHEYSQKLNLPWVVTIVGAKGSFHSESVIPFSNLQNEKFQTTILSLKF